MEAIDVALGILIVLLIGALVLLIVVPDLTEEAICYDLGKYAPSEEVEQYCDLRLKEAEAYSRGKEDGEN